MNQVATVNDAPAAIMEAVLLKGDLGKLTPAERNSYYMETCRSLGLNYLTRPFEYLQLSGRTVLYARRDCSDQLRKLHGVNIAITDQKAIDGMYMVTVVATDKTGRQDSDMGVVTLPQGGEARANAVLKCITKAKRRVTLSICGLGFLDETEVEDIPARDKAHNDLLKKFPPLPQLTPHQSPAADPASGPAPSTEPHLPLVAPASASLFTDAGSLSPDEKHWDEILAVQAAGGVAVLQAQWDEIPKPLRKNLKDRLDKVHKPIAIKADAEFE